MRYQLARLSFGNATSGAPIISGSRKLPSVVGMSGTRKNQTMMIPCSVNTRLYASSVRKVAVGEKSSSRISVAATPPMKKKAVTITT